MDPTVLNMMQSRSAPGPDAVIDEEGQDRIFAIMAARKQHGANTGLYSRSVAASADAPSKHELRRYADEFVFTGLKRVKAWQKAKEVKALQAAECARQKLAAENEGRRQEAAATAEEKRAAAAAKAEAQKQDDLREAEALRRAEALRAADAAKLKAKRAENESRLQHTRDEEARRLAAAAKIRDLM